MAELRCDWLIDHGEDEPPTLCARPARVVYVRRGFKRGSLKDVARYPRCTRHDTTHARAIINASDEWVVEDVV